MLRLQVRLLAAEAAFNAGERGIAQHLLLLLPNPDGCSTLSLQAEPVTNILYRSAITMHGVLLRLQVRLLAAEAAFDAGERGIAQHLLLLLPNPDGF
jgi:hypothetical protein